MIELIFHHKTRLKIENLINNIPQSILVTGKQGSGKKTTINYIACQLLKLDIKNLVNYPYFKTYGLNDSLVLIEDVRNLQEFLKLRVPSNRLDEINRVVILHNADRMSKEAQNALLKTLEEPPKGTVIILSATNKDKLLLTITSRLQELELLPISKTDAKEFFRNKYDSEDHFFKFYSLSQGNIGLLSALIDNQDHQLVQSINQAKQLLTLNKENRIFEVEKLSKDKTNVYQILDALLRICHAALINSSYKDDFKSINNWQNTERKVLESIELINKNVQVKLVLDNLFLNI